MGRKILFVRVYVQWYTAAATVVMMTMLLTMTMMALIECFIRNNYFEAESS